MFDTTSSLMNARLQVRWEAVQRVDRLEMLFGDCLSHRPAPLTRWRVALGEALIRQGQRMINEHQVVRTLRSSPFNPCS